MSGTKVVAHILDRWAGKLDYPVELFPNRAKMMGNCTVILPPVNGEDKHLQWLVSIGLGPKQVLRTVGSNMTEGILNSQEIRHHLQHAESVQFFSPSPEYEGRIITELGLKQVMSCPPHLTGDLNDKIFQRRLINSSGVGDQFFLPYRIINNTFEDVLQGINQLNVEAGPLGVRGYVIKAPDKASGCGQLYIASHCDPVSCLRIHDLVHSLRHDGINQVIVEKAFLGDGDDVVSCSIVFALRGQSGVQRAQVSQQLVDITDQGQVHWHGNIICCGSAQYPALSDNMINRCYERIYPLACYFNDVVNVVGDLCFDLLVSKSSGDVYLLEINPRVTFSGYGQGVLSQVAVDARWVHTGCAVVLTNVEGVPAGLRSFQALKAFIEERGELFNWNTGGTLLYLTEMLECEQFPMFVLASVSPDAQTSLRLSESVTSAVLSYQAMALSNS